MKSELTFRLAVPGDLAGLITMLADDPLGISRETTDIALPQSYAIAFDRIRSDVNQELTVAEIDGELIGTFQLTFIQYLTHQGGLRAQVEAVRVKSTHRGQGIGTHLFRYIIGRAKEKGCFMVQLTTDKKRPKALQFYENLGFQPTHEGMKLPL